MTFSEMAAEPIPRVEPGEKAVLLRLTQHAELALRSGLPLPTYLECDWLTRRAFIAASDSLRALAAQRAGLAAHSPMGAALSGADVDGGEAAELVFLTQQTALAEVNMYVETQEALRVA